MFSKITTKSIFLSWQTLVLILGFFVFRIASFLLADFLIIQGVLVFLLIMSLGILYFKNPDLAWYLVLTELFLGGSGHLLEFAGLSIRTLLIGMFLFLWVAYSIGQRVFYKNINIDKKLFTMLAVFFIFLIFSVLNAMYNQHDFVNIVHDLMPFLFLVLLFPSYHLFKKEKTQEYLVRLMMVFVICTSVMSLFTFTLFSTGAAQVHDNVYNWYRDVNVAKITDMGNGFFRVVEPEHLLFVPIILLISSLLMRDEKHHKMWRLLLILSIIVLTLNLSRGYFLALLVGLLILKYKHKWKRWFIITSTTIGLVVLIFSSMHLLSSQGKSFGWELFGVRIMSVAEPQIEISSNTRMMILPRALEMIKHNPILGSGLGAVVAFVNTDTYEIVNSTDFDWGYLELLVELGILGTLLFLSIIFYSIYKLIEKIKNAKDWHDFYVGLLAGSVAFLIMNITAPALFHIFGILFLVFIITISIKPEEIFSKIINTLYKIFNKIDVSV